MEFRYPAGRMFSATIRRLEVRPKSRTLPGEVGRTWRELNLGSGA